MSSSDSVLMIQSRASAVISRASDSVVPGHSSDTAVVAPHTSRNSVKIQASASGDNSAKPQTSGSSAANQISTDSAASRVDDVHPTPTWFRNLLSGMFVLWLVLQGVTEYFDMEAMNTYFFVGLFQNEREVDSAFVTIMASGVLTVGCMLGFIHGFCGGHKLAVLASAGFVSVLVILNVLSVAVLFASRMPVKHGPIYFGERILTLYHENMTEDHWRGELDRFARAFPLQGISATPPPILPPTTESVSPLQNLSETSAVPGVFSSASITAGPPVTLGQSTTTPGTATGHPPTADTGRKRRRRGCIGGTEHLVVPYPDVLEYEPPDAGVYYRRWYAKEEIELLRTLRFVQEAGFCCGINSYKDYAASNAQIPGSCSCEKSNPKIPIPCSENVYKLASHENGTVWGRSCRDLVYTYKLNLFALCGTMIVTTVQQCIIVLLSVAIALNMRDKEDEDY